MHNLSIPLVFGIFLGAAGCTVPDRIDVSGVQTVDSVLDDGTVSTSGDALVDLGVKDLVKVAFALDQTYQELAFKTEQINHGFSAAMIVAALAIALNDSYGVSAEVIGRRTMAALGINQVAEYADGKDAARALRIASKDSLCIASSISTEGTQETANGVIRDDYATKAKIVTALRWSHNNLRLRLSRKPVGLIPLLDKLRSQETLKLADEDHISLSNELLLQRAKANNDPFAERLYGCLH